MNNKHCGVEQWLARQAHNLKAIGSIPIPATKKIQSGTENCIRFFYFHKNLLQFSCRSNCQRCSHYSDCLALLDLQSAMLTHNA